MDLSSFLTCAAVLPSNVVAREKEYVSWCLSSIVGVGALERELYSACPLRRITCALTCQLRPCRVYSLSLSSIHPHIHKHSLALAVRTDRQISCNRRFGVSWSPHFDKSVFSWNRFILKRQPDSGNRHFPHPVVFDSLFDKRDSQLDQPTDNNDDDVNDDEVGRLLGRRHGDVFLRSWGKKSAFNLFLFKLIRQN